MTAVNDHDTLLYSKSNLKTVPVQLSFACLSVLVSQKKTELVIVFEWNFCNQGHRHWITLSLFTTHTYQKTVTLSHAHTHSGCSAVDTTTMCSGGSVVRSLEFWCACLCVCGGFERWGSAEWVRSVGEKGQAFPQEHISPSTTIEAARKPQTATLLSWATKYFQAHTHLSNTHMQTL